MIKFNCPLCGKKIGVEDQHAGRKARCPGCKQTITIPAQTTRQDIPVAKPVQPTPTPPSQPQAPSQQPRSSYEHPAFSQRSTPEKTPFADGVQAPLAEHANTREPQHISNKMLTRIASGITASTALLALIMFFLPWISFSCGNTEIAGQSGFQIAVADITINEAVKEKFASGTSPQQGAQDLKADWPLILLPISLVILIALGIATSVSSSNSYMRAWVGAAVLSAAGFLLFFVYLIAGFALERNWDEAKETSQAALSDYKDPESPFDTTAVSIALFSQIKVTRTAGIYLFIVFMTLSCISTGGVLACIRGLIKVPT